MSDKKYCLTLLALVVLAIFISCNNRQSAKIKTGVPLNAIKIKLQLEDSLGVIDFFVPVRYDTSISWVDYSDCGKSCDTRKYRFQPKGLRITKERGFIWTGEPKDSIERFTISHSEYFPFHDGVDRKDSVRHQLLKHQLIEDLWCPTMVFDTIERINDRYFSVYVLKDSGVLQSRKVIAVTTIKSNPVKFQFDLLTQKNDSITRDFIKNAIDLIATIRIEKGI
jgi:hypothetical protein